MRCPGCGAELVSELFATTARAPLCGPCAKLRDDRRAVRRAPSSLAVLVVPGWLGMLCLAVALAFARADGGRALWLWWREVWLWSSGVGAITSYVAAGILWQDRTIRRRGLAWLAVGPPLVYAVLSCCGLPILGMMPIYSR